MLGATSLDEVRDRLESGEAPHDLARALGLGPRDLIEALAAIGLGWDDQDLGPTLVQRAPPRPKLGLAVTGAALSALLPTAPVLSRLALRAGLCQVLDFWDDSHQAAQEADDRGEGAFSAYWHGIAHRREPDPSNASYWFRRVGQHPLFPILARASSRVLTGPAGAAMAERVVRGGSWGPFGFIDVCAKVRAGTPEETLARRLQRLEMVLLLEKTCEAALGGGSD